MGKWAWHDMRRCVRQCVRAEGTCDKEACSFAAMPVTEVHPGCTCEEQLRLVEGGRCGAPARRRGSRTCAVTAWSLLGACRLNSPRLAPMVITYSACSIWWAPRPRPYSTRAMLRDLARARRALSLGCARMAEEAW